MAVYIVSSKNLEKLYVGGKMVQENLTIQGNYFKGQAESDIFAAAANSNLRYLGLDSGGISVGNLVKISERWRMLKWSPTTHPQFPYYFRKQVCAVLKLALVRNGNPAHPECDFHRLPTELLWFIFQLIWKS
jgi:hypothetical protein